jgi:hypothetical protein
MRTPFEQFVEDVKSGKKKTPVVFNGNGQIPYIQYQLACHKRDLSLWKAGMKVTQNFKVSSYKEYYGLKGNDRTKLLEQFMEIFNTHIKKYGTKN